MRKLQAVAVDWIDSQTTYGWRRFDGRDDSPPCQIKSVGWLIDKNTKTISISTSCSQNGNFVDFMTIPRCAVKKIKKVKV